MAKGNDGNYLQHCVEVEAAARLTQLDTQGGIVTLTGFTLNLGKLSMASLHNVSGLASWRQAENSL